MTLSAWPPAILLAFGALLATAGVRSQRSLPLRETLQTAVPGMVEGFRAQEVTLSRNEEAVTGVTSYLSRLYQSADTASTTPGPRWFTVYVGYYARQVRGKTIHSPKNCLPGSGWEPLTSQTIAIETPGGPAVVNRYLIQRGTQQALVLYWYQGRGRVASNEYAVKWDLVRDAALRRRSEEALVRIVVPVRGSESDAVSLASRVAGRMIQTLGSALPS